MAGWTERTEGLPSDVADLEGRVRDFEDRLRGMGAGPEILEQEEAGTVPEPAPTTASEYLYHVTAQARLPRIAQVGLEPQGPTEAIGAPTWFDGSTAPRSYFTTDLENIFRFAPDEGEYVIFRVPRDAVELESDAVGFQYTAQVIPPEFLEMRTAEGEWWPLPTPPTQEEPLPGTSLAEWVSGLGGSPGIVVDEQLARTSPCTRINLGPGRKPLVYSAGVIGALDEEQQRLYCEAGVVEKEASEAQKARLQALATAARLCSLESREEKDPRRRLEQYFGCLGRQLAKYERAT